MATATANKSTTANKTTVNPAKSAAAKKAAATRKANKDKKEQEAIKQQQKLEQKEAARAAAAAKPIKIADVICETLLLVNPDSSKDRPEGYPYDVCLTMVLERIHKVMPEAKTSLNCLRWYANKMRSEEVLVPYRPRSVPKTTAKVVDPTK